MFYFQNNCKTHSTFVIKAFIQAVSAASVTVQSLATLIKLIEMIFRQLYFHLIAHKHLIQCWNGFYIIPETNAPCALHMNAFLLIIMN